MAFFGAKKDKGKDKEKGGITGFTKPKRFLFLKVKSKPIYSESGSQPPLRGIPQIEQFDQKPESPQVARTRPLHTQRDVKESKQPSAKLEKIALKRPTRLQIYFAGVAAKHKGLEAALRTQNMKESPAEFIKKMFIYSAIVSIVIVIATIMVLVSYAISLPLTIVLTFAIGIGCFFTFFNKFVRYPVDRSTVVGKEIERDILFAARDLVISMRSGMPLFNAITAVSTGYGAASLEFAKVVEFVQLGSPIEQALDDVSSRSQSRTFKRIMLQATVSLKAGADVVSALQGVVDEVMQERVIELRRYGQRLNALAMFYMLFGVIFPSMGIAVLAILTTFINLFTVDESTLIFALVGIFFLQIIFLNIMRSSRPTFAM